MFDMLDGFYEDEKIFAVIKYVVPLLLISYYLVKESALKKSDFMLLVVVFYLLLLLIYNHGDIIISGKTVLSVLLALIMIPVGKNIGRKHNFLEEFEPFNRFLLVIIPIYIILANIFKIGNFFYTEAFTTGFLVTSRMYVVPIVVFLGITYSIGNKKKSLFIKTIDLAFIILNIVILIINTRRTTFAMLLFSLLVYGFLYRKIIFKMVIMIFAFVFVLVISYPIYEEALTAQLEKRERIQNIDTYEEEGRYLETLYIFDYHNRRQNVKELFFGIQLFDTYDFGTKYFGRDRPIHSDINMLFFSTGILGLILFVLLFADYFLRNTKKIIKENRKIYYPLLFIFFIVLIPGRFIGTLTYAPLLMLILAAVKAQRVTVVYPNIIDNNIQPTLKK